MMQNWTKTITRKNEDDQNNLKKYIHKILSMVRKNIIKIKIIYGI